MEIFNIGDRVVSVVDCPADNNSICAGDTGTVCGEVGEWDDWICVCWDNPVDGGHDCGGKCEYGHGWNVSGAVLAFEPDDSEPPFLFDDEEFHNLFN